MKALKLGLIFLVLLGGIFVAMNWGDLFSSAHTGEDAFVKEDLVDIGQKCEEIRETWLSLPGWDEDTYRKQRESIEQKKGMGMFSREGYNAVSNCIRETSVNKACEGYMAALHKEPFSERSLRQQWEGVEYLKAEERLENDTRVRKVEQLEQLYRRIRQFMNDSHAIHPIFDAHTYEWVPFANRQNQILSTARSLRQNPLFGEMESVPGFKEALDEAGLQQSTDAQKERFYTGLSAQICRHFESEEATRENLDLLNRVYKRFVTEQKQYGVAELATLVVDFRGKVNKSETLKEIL